MTNFFSPYLSVNQDQINLAKDCLLQQFSAGQVFSTDNVKMYNNQGNQIPYFNALVSPKNITKMIPDKERIPSKGDWTLGRFVEENSQIHRTNMAK